MTKRILAVIEQAFMLATPAGSRLQAGHAAEPPEGARRAREVMAQDDVALAIVAPQGLGAPGVVLANEIKQQVDRLILISEPAETMSADLPEAARLSRPFTEQELLALVKAELSAGASSVRPANITPPDAPQVLRFEGYVIDAQARTCLDLQ